MQDYFPWRHSTNLNTSPEAFVCRAVTAAAHYVFFNSMELTALVESCINMQTQASASQCRIQRTDHLLSFPFSSVLYQGRIESYHVKLTQFGLILDHANILPNSDTQLHALHMHQVPYRQSCQIHIPSRFGCFCKPLPNQQK